MAWAKKKLVKTSFLNNYLFGKILKNQQKRLTTFIAPNLNTKNVTDMSYMFREATSLTSLDASGWDTSKVTHMSYMFSEAAALTELNVSGWNVSNVTYMNDMFGGTSLLTKVTHSFEYNTNVSTVAMFSSLKLTKEQFDAMGTY